MRVTIDHVGIAVSNLADALAFYRDALGLEVEPPEDVPSQRVRAHLVHLADTAERGEWASGVNRERGEGVPAKPDRGTGAPGVNGERGEGVPAKPDRGTGAPGVNGERGEGVPAKPDRGTGAPGVNIELLEATADDSPIATYLVKRGPGIHHLTLRVDDLVAALAQLKARGVRLIDEVPRPGAHGSQIAFIHPASAHGVLVELKQG
jgi:catechol 2,3-dioxygenase-like lactoylglutathione lyase family enzyme